MSLILKGIDLDEITAGNGYARLEIEEDGTVRDDISDIIIGYAIQIPKDHGNIIEESKAIVTETIDGYYEITAPTISEAERECERCKHKGDEYWCRDAYKDDEGKCSIYEPYGGIEAEE